MNTTLKNALAAAGIVAMLFGIVILNKYVNAYGASIQPSSFRSFTASGEGKIVAVPDVAQFSFGVISEGGTNIAELQKNNTEKMNASIALLKNKGVDQKDIKTEQYSLQPRMEYANCQNNSVCPPPKIAGYTISQTVSVKIRQFDKIGDIMSGVAQLGVNSVSNLTFTIDDPKKLQNDARAQAIEDAKNKAEAIAKAGGFSVGKLLSIDEGYQPLPMVYRELDMQSANKVAEAAPAPTIEAGSTDVSVQVTLRYEID